MAKSFWIIFGLIYSKIYNKNYINFDTSLKRSVFRGVRNRFEMRLAKAEEWGARTVRPSDEGYAQRMYRIV